MTLESDVNQTVSTQQADTDSDLLSRLNQVVVLNQARSKVWRWSEMLEVSGLLPSQLSNLIQLKSTSQPLIDPLWTVTQSYKNYEPWYMTAALTHFSDPAKFQLARSYLGVATELVFSHRRPLWASGGEPAVWYWNQLRIMRWLPYLRAIPSIQEVWLLSSNQMEVASSQSDVDLAVRCRPSTAWLARFYLKIILKLTRVDVHSVRLDTLDFSLRLLDFGLGRAIRRWPRSQVLTLFKVKCELFRQQVRGLSWRHKQRPGSKIDVGLIYDQESSLRSTYGDEPRQVAWLWRKIK